MIFFFIPAIVFVIAFMLLGGIRPGGFITILGWISFIAGLVFLARYFRDRDDGDYYGFRVWAPLCLIGGVLLWIFGGWFGNHSLFEFLFGTGWF